MGVSRMQSDAGWGWVRSLRSLREGVLLLLEGARFLRRERRLWALALIPVLFALFFVAVATSLFWVRLEGIHAFWVATLPVIEAGAWWSWSWVGPGRLLLWLLGWLAVLGSFAVSLVAALLLANLASAPFLDRLSQRVEAIASGLVFGHLGGRQELCRRVVASRLPGCSVARAQCRGFRHPRCSARHGADADRDDDSLSAPRFRRICARPTRRFFPGAPRLAAGQSVLDVGLWGRRLCGLSGSRPQSAAHAGSGDCRDASRRAASALAPESSLQERLDFRQGLSGEAAVGARDLDELLGPDRRFEERTSRLI